MIQVKPSTAIATLEKENAPYSGGDSSLNDKLKEIAEAAVRQIKPKKLSERIRAKVLERVSDRRTQNPQLRQAVKPSPRETKNRRRMLEWIKEGEAGYIVGVSVNIGPGCSDIHLTWTGLGLQEALEGALNESGTTTSIPVFKFLKQSQQRLNSKRNKLYRDYAFQAEGIWVVPASNLVKFEADCALLEAELENEKRWISWVYPYGHQDFLERIGLIIDSQPALTEEEVNTILDSYDRQFPTLETIQNRLSISRQPYFRIPALLEQAQENAELKEALAKEEAARVSLLELETQAEIEREKALLEKENALREARLQREQLEASENARSQWVKAFQQSTQSTIDWANAQILSAVEAALSSMETVLEEDDSPINRNTITRQLKKVEQYFVKTSKNFSCFYKLVETTKSLTKEVFAPPSHNSNVAEVKQQIQARIATLREQVKTEYVGLAAGGNGHYQAAIDYMEI